MINPPDYPKFRAFGTVRETTWAKRAIMYQPKHVRLFIKPHCPWCAQAVEWLKQRGIRYDLLDVIGSRAARDEMVRLSGQSLAPVIEVDGRILADFGPPELAAFWDTLTASAPTP